MNLSNIPEQGMIYALYRERVVYQPYKKEDQELEKLLAEEENLLELHLFDDVKEYRYIKKRQGTVEVCVEDSALSFDDSYVERIYTLDAGEESLEEHDGKIRCIEVVNYITYDENDMIKISDYRLKEVKA